MCNKIITKNAAVYLLCFANLVYALKNGFNWLNILTFCLTGILLVWDIVEVIQNARK